MPYQCTQNKEQYFENLCNINAFIENINTTNFMVIGDWNANLREGGKSLFGPTMIDFCKENNLVISTKSILPPDSYTHISTREGNTFKTWIDHVVSSNDLHNAINKIEILQEVTDVDHFPLIINLNVNSIPKVSIETNNIDPKFNWHSIKDSEINKYYSSSCELLACMELPISALNCRNIDCKDETHTNALNCFYNNILDSIRKAGSHLYSHKSENYTLRPGWTEHVAELYKYSKKMPPKLERS